MVKFISALGSGSRFDPLEYMVEAHTKRGLNFTHGLILPSNSGSMDVTKLSEDNIARKWLTDSSTKMTVEYCLLEVPYTTTHRILGSSFDWGRRNHQ